MLLYRLKPHAAVEGTETFGRLAAARLLVLDDLGAERDAVTDDTRRTLLMLYEARHDAGRRTVWTSNKAPSEIAAFNGGRPAVEPDRRAMPGDRAGGPGLAAGQPRFGGAGRLPDAQIEYVDAAGRTGRCNVEVASEHYRGRSIRARARAGFALYAPTARAASAISPGVGRRERRPPGRRPPAGRPRGGRAVRPWKVGVGLTASAAALGIWGLWVEAAYLHPFWRVVVVDYGLYVTAYGGMALAAFGTGVYAAARGSEASSRRPRRRCSRPSRTAGSGSTGSCRFTARSCRRAL